MPVLDGPGLLVVDSPPVIKERKFPKVATVGAIRLASYSV